MTTLAHKQGYKDLASFRAAINNDPKWTPKSEQQIIDDFAHYIHQMEPKLPELFTLLPKSPVTVEGIPDFDAAAATHYNSGGHPDGKQRRPRRRRRRQPHAPARLSSTKPSPTHEARPPAITCRSAMSSQQLRTACPKFRRRGGYSAYTSRAGRCMRKSLARKSASYTDFDLRTTAASTPNSSAPSASSSTPASTTRAGRATRSSPTCTPTTSTTSLAQTETDRYIAWSRPSARLQNGPAQKIRELRDRAQARRSAPRLRHQNLPRRNPSAAAPWPSTYLTHA